MSGNGFEAAVIETLCSFVPAHLVLSISVQQLEARQPHAGLRVCVDVHTLTRPEPQQLLHPAHPAAEAVGPSITASTHRKNGPHLLLAVTLKAHAPHQISPTPHLCRGGQRENIRHSLFLCHFLAILRLFQPSKKHLGEH